VCIYRRRHVKNSYFCSNEVENILTRDCCVVYNANTWKVRSLLLYYDIKMRCIKRGSCISKAVVELLLGRCRYSWERIRLKILQVS